MHHISKPSLQQILEINKMENFEEFTSQDRNRSYGLGPAYPEYFEETIEFQKSESISNLLHKNKCKAFLLQEWKTQTQSNEKDLRDRLKPHLKKIYKDKNFKVFDRALVYAVDSCPLLQPRRDEILSLYDKLTEGVPMTGPVKPCGFWTKLMDEVVNEKAREAEMSRKRPKSHPVDHWAEEHLIEEMWRQKEILVKDGVWEEATSSDLTELGASIAFPVVQPNKVRVCIDFREQNLTQLTQEKMANKFDICQGLLLLVLFL